MLSKVENKKNALRFILAISKPYPELAEAHFSIAHTAYFAGDLKLAEKELDKRIKSLETSARSKLLEQYANPVIRKIQST